MAGLPAVPDATVVAPDETLSATGTDAFAWAVLALLLLGGGALLVVVSRRRQGT